MNDYADPIDNLRWAAEQRDATATWARNALDTLNQAVHEARAAGVSAAKIAEAIGTSRQRVYEILREG